MTTASVMLDNYLDQNGFAYTLSGATVTLTGDIVPAKLKELLNACSMAGYAATLVSGDLKLIQYT